jgi:hypothetical protein
MKKLLFIALILIITGIWLGFTEVKPPIPVTITVDK